MCNNNDIYPKFMKTYYDIKCKKCIFSSESIYYYSFLCTYLNTIHKIILRKQLADNLFIEILYTSKDNFFYANAFQNQKCIGLSTINIINPSLQDAKNILNNMCVKFNKLKLFL